MRLLFMLLAPAILAACDGGRSGEVAGHVPLTVGGITYQWPTDSTTDFADLGRPETWRGYAFIPAGIWNEGMSAVPGARRSGFRGQIVVQVVPARFRTWAIQPDGKGLPLSPGERFKATEQGDGFTLGLGVGEGTVNPPVLVTFANESQAYAVCTAPSRPDPTGACHLRINDRGVEHTIPLGWGKWASAKAMLFLYRTMVGIPQPSPATGV